MLTVFELREFCPEVKWPFTTTLRAINKRFWRPGMFILSKMSG